MKIFKGKSIHFTVSVSFTVISMISTIILGQFLYLKVASTNKELFKQNTESSLEQINLNVDYYLKNMMSISDSIYYNIIKKSKYNKEDFYESASILHNINKDFLVNISIFSEDGDIILGYPYQKMNSNINVSSQDWFLSAIKSQENLHFSLPKKQNLFLDTDVTDIISLSRSIELTNENGVTKQGILLIDMNFRGIEQIFKNINISQNGYVFLTDKIGNIIYHPDMNNNIVENNAITSQYEDGSIEEVFNGSKRLATVKTVGYTAWKIISIIPSEDIMTTYKSLKVFFVILTLISIFILILVNKLVSKKITRPLIELTNKVIDFENGNDKSDLNVNGSYEVEHLSSALTHMVFKMNILIKNIIIEQDKKRKIELDVLQAQINPHFLYNTLDSVIWMIEGEKNKEAINMIKALARLFRISLSKGENIIKVSSEIEHIKNYLTIQKIRYKSRFEYKINIAENIQELLTIKLIMQPIVENSIYHGLEHMYDEGEIVIDVLTQEDFLIIRIKDNGCGMTSDISSELLNKDRKLIPKGSGVGIRNVNERIKLHFGDDYGVFIYSEPDEGTLITLKLPLLKENNK